MNKSYEDLQIDIGLEPQSIASSGVVTGPYYDMAEYREALVVTNISNIIAGGYVATQIRQAATSTGGSAANLTARVATVSANVKVKALTVTLSGGTEGDTITFVVDGTTHTYTGQVSQSSSGGLWSSTGDDVADGVGIVACINDATVGFDTDKAFASESTGVITVEAKDGYYLDSVAETGSFTTFATTKANSYVWFSGEELTSGLPYVAAKVENANDTGICSAVLIRGKKKGAIDEKVGAQYPPAI
ncbi:hypothetical protein ES703_17812 [subsurface metagenome]